MKNNTQIGSIVRVDVPGFPKYGKVTGVKTEDDITLFRVDVSLNNNARYLWFYDGELEMVSTFTYVYYVIKGLLTTLLRKDKHHD